MTQPQSSGLVPVLLAPFSTGLVNNREPWLMPADAFQEVDNFNIHHGWLEKRQGYRFWGNLGSSLRVMGLVYYLENDGSKTNLAFDTKYGYIYNTLTNVYDDLDSGAQTLDGGEYDYIWSVNWQSSNIDNRLYYTNGLPYDGTAYNGIRFYPKDAAHLTDTDLLKPSLGGGLKLYGAKLLFTIGQRLVCLYTYENNGASTSSYPQRARWCARQDPSNWDDTVGGGGAYADAATGDQIISAQALQNQIIVFFTNSVWTLTPTSDPNKAFKWSRLNNFRACDGKMASVAYDRYSTAVGLRGITSTDATETRRSDTQIPDFAVDEINFAEFKKVFCFRDYASLRWWTLYASEDSTENNSALIYDDESQAYTTYSIALNCLGFGNSSLDYKLSDFTSANGLDFSLNDMSEETLQSFYLEAATDTLLGGTTNGFVYQLDISSQDAGTDFGASFTTAAWNPFQIQGLESQMSYVDFYVDTDPFTLGTVEFYKNDQVSPYASQPLVFLPNLDYLTSIAQIDKTSPCAVNAPQHGLTTGDVVFIYGVQGMVQVSGEYTVTVVDENNITLDGINATGYTTYVGGGALYRREFYQTKTWIRAYGGGIGYLHWIKVTINEGKTPMRFHAIKPYFRPIGTRTIN